MKCVVWSVNIKEGNSKLEQIIENYTKYGITIRDKKNSSTGGSSVEFSNGDYWRVCGARDNFRGTRCNIAYIQRNIPYDIYRTIISPCILDFPFSAIQLWGEGNLYITDKLMIELPFI